MKKKKVEIFQLDRARPNWRHQAFGIQRRADWTNARVFQFSEAVGGIIAYNTEHARMKHDELVDEMNAKEQELEQSADLFE